MFARVYRKVREMRRKGTSLVALVALLASGFTFLEAPAPASAAIVTSNLVINLDASNTSSMAASGATGWNSVSPASSTSTSTFVGNAARVSDGTGASMSMDGIGDAAVFPVGVGRSAGSMTVDTWIKPGNLRTGWNIFATRWFGDSARSDLASAQDWHFGIYGTTASNLKLQLNTGAGILTSNTVFPSTGANKWYHVAFTIDSANNNTATLWINGVAEGTIANFPHTDSSTAQLHVGDVGTENTTGLAGNMSRFRIYNAALTPAQMAQNFLTDSANYGYAPANTVVPTVSGIAKVGTALSASTGTWGLGDADGTTTTYQWQSSTDGSNGWTNISGATAAAYTPVANDATNYLRAAVTKTNSAGNATAYSAATMRVQAASGTALVSGGKLTGLTTTVPNDANTYNVTLATSNLSATMTLGTTTGLTWFGGYASTASYMATSLTNAAPIVSFRGTGTAINTALANVTYTSSTKQTDVVKLYYATAGATTTDTKNYIPIYDNNQLTFHYYTFKNHAVAKNRAEMDASLVGLTTTDNVQAPGPWYLVTPRYQIEWTRTNAVIGGNTNVYMGATSANGSTDWYWPANTDGYSSATKFATNGIGSSNIFNGTSTTLPYCSGEPNGGSTGDRSGYFYLCGGGSALGWDDVPANATSANFVMETFGTAPFNSGAAGVLAQTVNVVASYADAPTGVTATASGTGAIAVTWNTATAATTGSTVADYRVEYSTASNFSPVSYVAGGASGTSALLSGLSTNTLYYVRVIPVTTAGWGTPSAGIAVTTLATATTITVVASGGGVSGTDYTIANGIIFPKSGGSVSVNVSEIQTSLGVANTILAADNVVISAPITWALAKYLQLGNSADSTVTINKTITSTANNSQLIIKPATYNLDVKNGASIQLTSANTQYLNIGGTAYTLIKTEAQLVAATNAAGNYAIAKPITLASNYTASPIAINGFTGKLDGLGNTIDSMKLNVSSGVSAGLIQNLNGGTIRNLGVTNISTNVSNTTGTANVGAIVGQSTGGILDQVWSSGFLQTASATAMGGVSLGGLIGNTSAGTSTISKSWSSVNITTANSTSFSNMLSVGSLVGSDVAAAGQASTSSGGNISMSQVYSTGGLATGNFNVWRGHGGLIGLHYSTATISISDAFTWSNHLTADTGGVGGIVGNADGGAVTLTNVYTRQATASWVAGKTTNTNVQFNVAPGAAVSAQAGTNWVTDSANGTYLKNVAKPYQNLYYQVVAPTDGAYSGMRTQLVDGAGQVQTLSALNLSTTGTPVYSILSNAAKATYNVSYISGITLGGTAAGLYTSAPWPFTTSVTISRFSQTVTWTPTTAINFGSGSFTPSAAPVSSAGSTISYAVTSAGTTGCTVNATTGVVTYTSAGSCEITATAAQTVDYAAASIAKTFVIADAATAPTVTAEGATSNSIVVSWTAPTVNASTALTGYQIVYSTSADMSSPTTINTGNTGTAKLITGLSTGTYYFKVRALGGSNWVGPLSATAATGSPKTVSTTITVVASGGGTLGTDYKIANGIVYTTAATANVNVADIQNALLTNDVTIASGNIVIDAPITWATSEILTLGTTTDGALSINSTITASGVNGGLAITPTSYSLKVKAGAEILLTGASTTLSIGGTAYTLIRSTSDLSLVTATGNFALAKPIAYLTSATALTNAPLNVTFTGTFDGLGNTVDRMILASSTAGNYGFMNTLGNGGTVRNLGVTNALITMGAGNYRVGAIAGGSTGGTMDQVWSTGLIKTTTNNSGWLGLGGLVGNATAGTLTISKSWSSVNINSSTTATTVALEQGGIIGGNEATIGSPNSQTGAVVKLDQVYATGTLSWASIGHRGIGGLFGLHYNTTASAQTITDSFSWVTFAAGVPANNSGGIFGVAAGSTSTVTMTYQATSPYCVAGGPVGFTATPSCDTQQTAGSTVAGISGAAWTTANGTTLANVATPTKQLFVKVVAPANGAYNGITYTIVDGSGTAVTLSSLNLSVSGTPVYSIASDVLISATAYKVDYVSGLTLGGSAAGMYSLAPWAEPTSVTISKYTQVLTWEPTTALSFGSGSSTPTAATALGGATITYAVTAAGNTACTVNASTGVLTYKMGGSCTVTATAAATTEYLTATSSKTFVIADPATLVTGLTLNTTGERSLVANWTAPTVNSSVPLSRYQVQYSSDSNFASSAYLYPTKASVHITGLTPSTTYYVRVRAEGSSAWYTAQTASVSKALTSAASTTIRIVASGGGVAGTDYKVVDGIVYAPANVSINASDINALFTTQATVSISGDTVSVEAPLSWSTNSVLNLANTGYSTVSVKSTITGTGATAGVVIAPFSYGLAVNTGAYIRLTGATPSFKAGGVNFVAVNTVAGLATVNAATYWALTAPITLSSTYTAAVKDFTYTGTMDGLGNTISNMQLSVTATRDAGFYAGLGGATIRNVGFTNVNIASGTGAISTRLGSVAGNGSSAGTNTISQVWATGFINQTSSATGTKTEAGGLFGGATAGTLNISKSWSSVAISTMAPSVGSGGIIGTNVSTFGGGTGSGNTLAISESYSTGNILRDLGTADWYGNAGIIGVAYGLSTTITDTFSWGNINSTGFNAGTSTAGISGVGSATISNSYTTHASCGGTATNCLVSKTAGAGVSGGTGFTSGLWQSVNGTSLVNVAPPTKNLYVQVIAPTDGTFGTMSYKIVDSTGTEQTLSALNLSVSGTPLYTIDATSAKATYPGVAYTSGLTLGGTSAAVYSLSAWITNTSVTISKFSQTVSFTSSIPSSSKVGVTYTPTATASSALTVAISVDASSSAVCSMAAGIVTFNAIGTCKVNANQTGNTDYVAATQVQQIVTVTKGDQTISVSTTALSPKVGTTYTPAATATSGGVVAFTIDDTSSSVCSIALGIVSFNAVGSCKLNANQAGNTNWNAATQVQQVITVAKGDQTVTFTSTLPTDAKVAGATYTPTATATSGVAVELSLDSASAEICSLTGGVISFTGVGDCIVYANEAGGTNWNAAAQKQQTISVAKGISTIVVTSSAPTNATVDGATYTITSTATAANTNSVVYSIDSTTSTICSIADAVVTFVKAGTCKVNANLASDTKYAAASQVQQVITVAKGTQTLAFTSAAPTTAKVGAPDYTVVVTGGASTRPLIVSVDAGSAGKCSINGLVVTYLAVGTCALNVNQAGDDNYLAANQVQQLVSITTDGRCPFGEVSGDYCLVRFNSSGSWTVPAGITTIDILAVGAGGAGGGGAGGNTSPGGGGGGEVLEVFARSVTAGTLLSASIGAGGVGGGAVNDATSSTNGGASSVTGSGFATITSRGGGAGATFNFFTSTAIPAGTGATVAGGGGGNGQAGVPPTTPGTGGVSIGGSGILNTTNASLQAGGGGGGAGGNGVTATSSAAGNGGTGKSSTILGTLLGGGGGGAKRQAVSGRAGTATAGGGAGGLAVAGTPGTANTGGGGGGSAGSNAGANGGSGVVVIRYAMTSQTVAFVTSAPTGLVYGTETTYTPSVSGGNSGAEIVVTVDSASSAVCSIASGVVSVIGAGTCTLNVNQAGLGNYASATQVQQSFTVAKQDQNIVFTNDPVAPKVNETFTPAATATSGGTVTFSISSQSSAICSIDAGVVTFNAAGSCVILGDIATDDNWNTATQATKTIDVAKATQTVTFTSSAPTGVRVGDTNYTPTATGGSSTRSVTIAVAASSSVVCSITNGEVAFTAVGSCVLELNQSGDDNYTAATQETQTITVAKGLQVITKTSTDPIDAVVAGATYTPTFNGGASGSDIVVAISSATAARCEILDGTISFISAGDCDVVVNQAGNSNYEAAPELTFTISVGKGSQALSWTSSAPSAAVVGGTTYTPTATGGASGNNLSFRVDLNTASVCAMSLGVVRFVGVGTCTVLVNQNGNNDYLAATQESQTFTVGQGSQVISFTSTIPAAVVDGATYTPEATGGATGNGVSFGIASASASVCSLAFGKVSFLTVGDCVIEANQLGNTNYLAAAQVTQTITVAKGAQTVSFTSAAPASKVGGATYTPVVSGGASGNAVTLSVASASSAICSVSNGTVSFQAVGSCVVEANQASNDNYEAAPLQTQTITVAKGVQVVNFTSTPPSLRPVQGTTYVPTATSGLSGEPVVFTIGAEAASICTISNGTISFLAVGDCVLYADQAGNDNFTAATRVTQTFDITKGEQVVAITSTAPTDAVVDGANYTPTGTGGAGTKALTFTATDESSGICTVLVGVVYFDGAGDCVLELNQAGDTNYNAATPKFQTITVGKGTQTITFTSTNTNATVDGALYTPTYTDGESINAVHLSVASGSALICEVVSGSVSFHAVGDCVIEATQAGDNNYTAATVVSQTISVAKGTQVALVGHSSLNSLTLGANVPTAVLNTTGGSGAGAVTWSVTSESAAYCSVSGEVVSGLASGYCDLVATKAADDNYLVATAQLTVVVSTGGQSPVRTSVSNTAPTFAEGLTLTLALAGGDGDGAVWFESLTTHVCNTSGGTTLNIYHSGICTVIGHKDGDDNYDAVQNALSFSVAKADQTGATIRLANALTYSASGAVTSALIVDGAPVLSTPTYSVTSGTCTIENGELSATEAGDCEVSAAILGDDKYLDGTFTETFTIAKATQTELTATLASDALPAIAWNGDKVTTYDIAGGSGVSELSVSTSTPTICSVAIAGSVVTITGLAQGACDASVSKASSANFLAASKLFSIQVLDLAAAPTSVAAAAPLRQLDGSITTHVSWVASVASSTRATITGYKVQSKVGTADWADVVDGNLDASASGLTVTVAPWTKYNFRVAATSELDAENLDWAYFDLSGDDTPDQLVVGGGQVILSTTKAATTSGEVVFVTGSGFEEGYTNRVELVSGTSIFAAGLRPAALVTSKIIPATYISPTKLSFVLPKITMPKGVTSLTTQIKVLGTDGVRSDPIPLDYIPKKLTQVLTVSGLPATKAALTIGSAVPAGLATSTGATPVVTATPANVCTAAIVSGQVTVTPVGRGICAVSVVAPGTPAYTASAAKAYSYTIKGAIQTLTFANPGLKTWSATPFGLVALSSASLPATFTSKTPTVCTVSGANLSMVKAGVCTIAATQAGDSLTEAVVANASHTQTFTINKADRTAGLTATTENVSATGERTPETFNTTSVMASQTLDVVIGDNPIEIPVTLNKREGTVLFTVDADSEKTSRCAADSGDVAGLTGAITLNDVGTCRVTISLPADASWNALLETVVIVINVTERPLDTPATPYSGDGEVDNSFKDLNPKDPDTEDAVAVALSGDAPAIALGGEEGLAYNAATGLFTFKSTSALVGTWKVTMTAPTGQLWFKTKGKVVKKVQLYVQTNSCVTTLTVKKDAKLKKRITRIIGPGCVLNDAGKAAFGTAPQKVIKIKYQRTRQYAKTGLSYVLKGKLKTRVLKPVKRTIVLKIGQAN